MKRNGSTLILVMLVLFFIIALVFVVLYSIQLTQANSKIVNNHQIIEADAYSVMQQVKADILAHDANYRASGSVAISEQPYQYTTNYKAITSEDRKFLAIDITTELDSKPFSWQAFSTIPLLDYAHFVINPEAENSLVQITEKIIGRSRMNNSEPLPISFLAEEHEVGKPYIYMNGMNLNRFIAQHYDLGLIINLTPPPKDVNIIFYDNQTMSVNGIIYPVNTVPIIIKDQDEKGHTRAINIFGAEYDTGRRTKIVIPSDVYISIITDMRIKLLSEISIVPENSGLLIATTQENTGLVPAIQFDINDFIYHSLYKDGVADSTSPLYGRANDVLDEDTEIKTIRIDAVLYAENGSFGITEKTFNSAEYNSDFLYNFMVYGGIIEYYAGYDFKKFDTLPEGYYNLICENNTFLVDRVDTEPFGFPILPCSSSFLFFKQ